MSACKPKGNKSTGSISALTKNPKVCVSKVHGNWVTGTYDGLKFQAKVFGTRSGYGINKGRVSKLWAKSPRGVALNFDRGWDKRPKGKKAKSLLRLMKRLG